MVTYFICEESVYTDIAPLNSLFNFKSQKGVENVLEHKNVRISGKKQNYDMTVSSPFKG